MGEGLGRGSPKEKRRGSPLSVGTFNDFLFANTYGNSNTGPDQVQENSYPSLRKGNGKMLCSTCLRPLEPLMPDKPKLQCSHSCYPRLTDRRNCNEHAKLVAQSYERFERISYTQKRFNRLWSQQVVFRPKPFHSLTKRE